MIAVLNEQAEEPIEFHGLDNDGSVRLHRWLQSFQHAPTYLADMSTDAQLARF